MYIYLFHFYDKLHQGCMVDGSMSRWRLEVCQPSPSGWNRFQPQIDPVQNRGTFRSQIALSHRHVDFFGWSKLIDQRPSQRTTRLLSALCWVWWPVWQTIVDDMIHTAQSKRRLLAKCNASRRQIVNFFRNLSKYRLKKGQNVQFMSNKVSTEQ